MKRDTLWWERLLETRPKMGRPQPHSCVQMQGALACAVRDGRCHRWSFLRLPEADAPPRPASARLPGPCSRGFIAPCPGSPLGSPSLRCGISCSNQSHVTCVVQ
uniref:Uncharacterized protein DKFZp434L2430 n=1 Tax=Homo sapiens TaxID=9606 RepID=Q69YW3_HUMAN|nr:hypothetical protein [Homo sapiens]